MNTVAEETFEPTKCMRTDNELKAYHLKKAREWLKKNDIPDPTGRLAQKCAKETIEFIKGERKNDR